MSFVYSIIDENGSYSLEEEDLFDNAETAINLAVIKKQDVAVLDAFSLEYYGSI